MTPERSATGGADRFYAALQGDILPHVESEHAVDPDRRVLVGHSNGGVFAWYAAFRHEHGEAPLFSGIVAADNGYDQQLIWPSFEDGLEHTLGGAR